MQRGPRPLPARLLLGLGALALALGAVEAAVRTWAPQPLGAGEAPPLLRGMLTAPGDHRVVTPEYDLSVHVNRAGFVDHEWGPKHGRRVVVIGDSFVQAAQVPLDDGFGRVLQRALGGDVEVLSLGIPGAGTATAVDTLDTWVFALQPDVVVLGFLVANDVMNNHPLLDDQTDKPFYRLTADALVHTDPVRVCAPWPWLWERSDTFRLVARTWAERREAQARLDAGADGLPLDLLVYAPETDARWTEAWQVTDALVGAMATRCHEHGITFGTLLFPDGIQATRAGRARANQRWPPLAAWHPETAQARAAALAAAHAPAFDLLPALGAADAATEGAGPPLYFPEDGHWTVEGHRVAAAAAAPFVAGLLAGAR